MKTSSVAESGYLYVLGVKDIDLPVTKIGCTSREPALRCAEINQSSTGDFLWEVVHQVAVNDYRGLESLVHAKLQPLRQKRREFFNIWPDDAIRAVQSVLVSSPDIREVAATDVQSEVAGAKKKTTSSFRKSACGRYDSMYAHLLDGFTELLGIKGRPFGQLNRNVFGISDGHDGVQWSLVIYPSAGEVRITVNLEGMKYQGWPITSLIKSELEVPELLQVLPRLQHPECIYLAFLRDAWQVQSRPVIAERYLGGREFGVSEITPAVWRALLDEAIGCLNKDKNHLGRSRQAVTLLRESGADPEKRIMEVSPHLTLSTPLDFSSVTRTDLSSGIDRLMPLYEWASKASAR